MCVCVYIVKMSGTTSHFPPPISVCRVYGTWKINQTNVTMGPVTAGSTRRGQGRELPNPMNCFWATGRQKGLRDLNIRNTYKGSFPIIVSFYLIFFEINPPLTHKTDNTYSFHHCHKKLSHLWRRCTYHFLSSRLRIIALDSLETRKPKAIPRASLFIKLAACYMFFLTEEKERWYSQEK